MSDASDRPHMRSAPLSSGPPFLSSIPTACPAMVPYRLLHIAVAIFVYAIAVSTAVTQAAASSTKKADPFAQLPDFSPRKIVLTHLHDDAPFFRALGALTLLNKARYCARHNYELAYSLKTHASGLWKPTPCDHTENDYTPQRNPNVADDDSDSDKCIRPDPDFRIDARAPTFGKIKLTLATCRTRPGYWTLWSDADALIVNQTVPLEDIIDHRYDIILSVDWLMINAGVIMFKCSPWTMRFLERVYAARDFDSARALDQSAFQHFFDTEPDMDKHLKRIPKHAMNVYAEEYRPGDFLVHMAGKLYEATTKGATAIAHQFDMLAMTEDVEDVRAFFRTPYILNAYSGVCNMTAEGPEECLPEDARRLQLQEPLLAMSEPNRYRHVGLRYYWLQDWKDIYDVPGWNDNRLVFDPSGQYAGGGSADKGRGGGGGGSDGGRNDDQMHDEL